MNTYNTPTIPARWFIQIPREIIPILDVYLRANTHKYKGYKSNWKITQSNSFFVSEGDLYHTTFDRSRAEQAGYKEITDRELKRLLLKGFYSEEKLPEKWFIRGGDELNSLLKEFETPLAGKSSGSAYMQRPSGIWWMRNIDEIKRQGYQEIRVEDFRRLSNHKRYTTTQITFPKPEIMQTHTETTQDDIQKDVVVTKPVKIKTIKKGKPVYIEREVTIYVAVAEDNEVYTGYSIRNPEFDKTHDEAMAIKIAKNRAFNSKTNLTRGEWITFELKTKFVLKGIAEQFFSKISKGQVLQISKA